MAVWVVAALSALIINQGAGPAHSDLLFESSGAASCGWWSSSDFPTGAALAVRYGEIRECGPLDQSRSIWVMTTLGSPSAPGVIAVDRCEDAQCRDGRYEHPLADWSVHRAPHPGGVTWLATSPAGVMVIDNGGWQITFDVDAGRFSTS